MKVAYPDSGSVLPGARPARSRLPGLIPVLFALLAAVFVTIVGLRADSGTGVPNSDDLVRIVQVRDLLAGQGWFDLTQYRLGLEGGTPMHWSRLVDAPIAALVTAVAAATGDAGLAEAAARIVWPALTLFLAMLALMAACARTANRAARPTVAVIGAVALWSTGVFAPGALDHHNVQIALSLWLLAPLLPGERPVSSHGAAGAVSVLMIAVGMEALPYVALAGAVVAAGFVSGSVRPAQLRAFGGAVAVSAVVIFAGTVAPRDWAADACDAFSSFHLVAGFAGGAGLWAASFAERTAFARGAALLLLAAGLISVIEVYYPHCLESPLAALDPRLREFWLEGVVETRSLSELWATDPFAVPGYFGLAVTALAVSIAGFFARDRAVRQSAAVFAAFLAMGIAVTAWQQRGFTFAAAFSVLPLGFWIARLRETGAGPLRLAAAWLVSLNLVWWVGGSQAAKLFSSAPTLQEQAASVPARDYCFTAGNYRRLALEPQGVVLGVTDLGPGILLHTPHRAVAGPYHRNTGGNLLLIEAMLGSGDTARNLLREAGVTHVADCLRSFEAAEFIRAAPAGFQARLRSGDVPGWLEPVAGTMDGPMPVYRVRP